MAKRTTAVAPPAYAGEPFFVIAKKPMYRGGRQWTTGVHEFVTDEQRAALGDDETIGAMLAKLALYPDDFEVKKRDDKKPDDKKTDDNPPT